MPNFGKNIAIWLFIFVSLMIVVKSLEGGMNNANKLNIAFSDFLGRVDNGEVADVTIHKSMETGTSIEGHFNDGGMFRTDAPDYPNLVDKLSEGGVKISANNDNSAGFWSAFLWMFPTFLFIAVYIYFMRQMSGKGGGGGGAMGFGKSRAKMLNEVSGRKTFDDVAGIDEAKEELEEIVDFLKDPAKFQKLGGKIPKGCLLVGPPGTGKTLLARSVAGEAGVPFFTISGSDFVEMFVGVGASRVRDMFEQGKKNAPCIIFIDEIDAVGRHRGAGIGGGNDEREQTLNQMLVEMDGFEANEGVIILAATNRPDVLDPALLRPGRFDRQITVPNPDIKGREAILNVHMKDIPTAPDIDPTVLARGTPGFSGADLANLVNEAALLAARLDKKVVTMREMEEAKDKVMMGSERKSMVMSDEEKKMTAYHEAGHAVVSVFSPASDPIHKATIIPRGRALGMVMRLPESDKISYLRDKMYADLAVSMGGRIAEEITFGHDKVSSGASSDIQYATRLSQAMVTEWGMTDVVGSVNVAPQNDNGYQQRVSPEMQNKIDEEVRKLVDEAEAEARDILTKNHDAYEAVAQGLLKYETLTGDEIKDLIDGKPIRTHEQDKDDKPVIVKSSFPSGGKTEKKKAAPKKKAAVKKKVEKQSEKTEDASDDS